MGCRKGFWGKMDPYSMSEGVCYMHLLGWSNANIAKELGLSKDVVRQLIWRRKHTAGGFLAPDSPLRQSISPSQFAAQDKDHASDP